MKYKQTKRKNNIDRTPRKTWNIDYICDTCTRLGVSYIVYHADQRSVEEANSYT